MPMMERSESGGASGVPPVDGQSAGSSTTAGDRVPGGEPDRVTETEPGQAVEEALRAASGGDGDAPLRTPDPGEWHRGA